METRKLGEDGPPLSVVGLGCNNFGMKLDLADSAAVIDAAIDAGITHFDTAEMYGGGKSEEFIGATLGSRRDQVVIATKFLPRPKDEPYTPGALRRRILEGCETSLRRLRTDRIDLYYQHYPDAEGPVDEALETLDGLVQAGKVLYIASSNVTGEQVDTAAKVAAAKSLPRYCGTQVEWNLLSRTVEQELVPAARAANVGIVPYFPLASGLLTGKYQRGEPYPSGSRLDTMAYFRTVDKKENFARLDALTAFAQERGHSILELAMAWLAGQQGVASIIAGATTPEQVRTNVSAIGWTLTDEDLATLP
ncbi:aldo/keto reductase [Nocardia sp. CA-120079]|uniref:aldo/keto reductase n=1 Tax=Nocardia sp. CA-120079 TaxID=3239974 RepID=UPI003D95D756